MKRVAIFLVLTLLHNCVSGQSRLYPITDGSLWGYIDKNGKTVVNPRFLTPGLFSEGLAAVRVNGTYGYIDTTGELVIAPRFDLATPFENGLAKVYIEGKPFFIDKTGNIKFQHNFKSISSFGNHSFAIAITNSAKYCLINIAGKLITDTIFKKIYNFNDGFAIVEGLHHLPDAEDSTQVEKFETGVIDSTGKWIIPYNQYKRITRFINGYATAQRFDQTEKEERWATNDAVIDMRGNQKFLFPAGKFFLDNNYEGFHDGLAVINIYPDKHLESWSTSDGYKGAINTSGQIVFSDTNWKEMTPFTLGRAFVRGKDESKWIMINSNGRQVGDSAYESILFDNYRADLNELFRYGVAYVKISGGWVAIDTNGRILSKPQAFFGIHSSHLYRVGNVIFFQKDISGENDDYPYEYGFFNTENNAMVSLTYHDIDMHAFNNDLIYAMKNGMIYYITNTGKVVWKQRKVKKRKMFLNIDFMNRGYYYAASPYKQELAGFGGWGHSDNLSKSFTPETSHADNQLQVILDTNYKAKWNGYDAIKLFVVNRMADTLYFPSQDSRLYLKLQAKDKNGEWRDIEYLPSSWCGNSYHTMFLASGEYWEFNTPIYQGDIKTTIRAQLQYKKSKGQDVSDTIYSNEIAGSVNPGQFWNKREYSPRDIMDPYND